MRSEEMNIISDSIKIIKTEGLIQYCVRLIKRGQGNFYYLLMWVMMAISHQSRFQLKDINEGQKKRTVNTINSIENSISRIINSYNLAIKDQKIQQEVYKISGDWAIIFGNDQQELIQKLKQGDREGVNAILSNFARDKVSRGLHLFDTIPHSFFHKLLLLNCYNKSYFIWKKMTFLPDEVLEYSKEIGNMHGIDIDGKSIMLPSFNQSYFAQKIDRLFTGSLKKITILEIGGGYGSLPYHLFKHTSLKCRYIYVDLPEMCTLATYFLMNHFPDKKILLYKESENQISDFSEYDIIILPNYCLPDLPERSVDLVFNSHSMTQMDPDTLKEYLRQINRICKKYFLHANNENENNSLTPGLKYLNLNNPEYELPKTEFKQIYRLPELIRNDGFLIPEYSSWEYLYERI
ncbi:MAG: putative sugar O-methyltransferase [Methanoregulaceae archaeon]|jgi:hypothetical protein